jgi:putative inorganic carbon (HCO3(-)) transporter
MRSGSRFEQVPCYLACAAVVAMLFSIAVSEVLTGLALIALFISRQKLRFPPILLPITVFFALTLISLAFSRDPKGGIPDIRKFFLYYAVPLALYTTLRTLPGVRALLLAATGVMTLSALWSLVQFGKKVQQAHELGRPLYTFYVGSRLTGFTSHWMVLGGQEMMLVLMAGAWLFFAGERRWKAWIAAAAAIILLSLLVGETRIIWFGTFCGGVYLVWSWKRWWVLALPLPILAVILINPFELRERVTSAFHSHGDTDSNQFRYVVLREGWEIVKKHPMLGLGPEQIKALDVSGEYRKWIPADIPRPLPTGWYGHLHNLYVQLAAERGIPAALVMMWLLLKILSDFLRGARRARQSDTRAILYGCVAMIIGTLAVGFSEYNLGESGVLTPFLGLVVCGYVAIEQELRQTSQLPLPGSVNSA